MTWIVPDVRNMSEAAAGVALRAALVAGGVDPATITVYLFNGEEDEPYIGTGSGYADSRGDDGSVSAQGPFGHLPGDDGGTTFSADIWGMTADDVFARFPDDGELVTTAALWGTGPDYTLYLPPADPGGPGNSGSDSITVFFNNPVASPHVTPRPGKLWKFLLYTSSDLELIGEMRNCHGRGLKVDLNKSGSARGWNPTSDQIARQVWPWQTCLVVTYGGQWYWSGPINSRNTSLASGQASFTAVDWFDRLMHLNLSARVTYTGQDASSIAAALLELAREQDPTIPITLGTVEATQYRTITYEIDQSIGQAIQDLAALESGYDWYIHPRTRQLNIVARRGVDRPNCKWLFYADHRSQQSNLEDVEEIVDGNTLVNDITPRGKSGSGHAEDPDSIFRYGRFQERPSLSDVVDPNILNAFANAEIVYRSEPRVTYTMRPKPSSKASVPKLFRDFDLGDTTYLTARRDYVVVNNLAQRIFGASLEISDTGLETLSDLQTTAS